MAARDGIIDEVPEVQGERLYLERLTIERHLDDFHEMWSDEETVRFSSLPPKETIEESRTFFASILPNDVNPDIDKFAIMLPGVLNAQGKPKMIGLVGTNRWSKDSEGMETGYCLNINYWGKGYATEAFGCFLKYFWTLEERKNMNLLVAKTSPSNVPSQRVLQKCGARKGEVIAESYVKWVDNGVKTDMWCWYFDRPGVELGNGEHSEAKE